MFFKTLSQSKRIIILFVVVLLLAGIVFVLSPKPPREPQQKYCTEEAMLCPDGSYVGRTGPNCEFSVCPKTPSPSTNKSWKTYTDVYENVSFQYPEVLTTKYINPVNWPPKVNVLDGAFACADSGNEVLQGGQITKQTINNRTYCVTKQSGAAAGNIYTDYTYATQKNGTLLTFSFTLHSVQCANYDDPQKTECLTERESFNVDDLVDKISQSAAIR